MPLMRGKSKNAFEHNIKAEMDAGKPMKQSLAIAYATKRRNKKAMGGRIANQHDEDMDRESKMNVEHDEENLMEDRDQDGSNELADVNSKTSHNAMYDDHDEDMERKRKMSGMQRLARGGQVNEQDYSKLHVDDDYLSDEASDRPMLEGRENAEGALEDIDDISDTSISDLDQEPGGKTDRKLLESIMRGFKMRRIMGGPKAGLD